MTNTNNLGPIFEFAASVGSEDVTLLPEFQEQSAMEQSGLLLKNIDVRDLILNSQETVELSALIGADYDFSFVTSDHAHKAVLLGLAFLGGSVPARPYCSNVQEAHFLILQATDWLANKAPRFNVATDVSFEVSALDGVPRPVPRSFQALDLVQRYGYFVEETLQQHFEAN